MLRQLLSVGLMTAITLAAGANPSEGKIAVLITDWGEFEGWSEPYRKAIGLRGRVAEKTEFPGQPCTEMHVGEFPFASQMGMIPHVLAFKTEGLEGAWDSFGVYRKSRDGQEFVALYDETVRVPVDSVPEALIKPMHEYPGTTGQPSRSLMGIDPRDGRNYLEGVYQIGEQTRGPRPNPNARPNGIRDLDEIGLAASLSDRGFLSDDKAVRGNPVAGRIFHKTRAVLWELFGGDLKVRFGAYAETPGFTETHDKVAVDLARDGYTRLVLTRETTDNNNYANKFMTLGHVYKGLCKADLWDDVRVEQVRQVGRTPEYNAAMMEVVRPQLEEIPEGSRVAILYTTYGLPWPGGASKGPFASPHPFAAEVYHENAYLNYMSFKRYLESTYGDRYDFVFTLPGKEDSDLRTDSLFSYAMFPDSSFGRPDDPARFRSLRQNLELAKEAGYERQVVVLSHWYYNNTDTLLAIRLLQKLPFNSREELANHEATIDWCEMPGSHEPVGCDRAGAARIWLTETFDRVPDQFAIGYAQRIRGGVERYGLLPSGLGLEKIATGQISKRDGGRVEVAQGPFKGASLEIQGDPEPTEPDRFTVEEYEAFNDPAKTKESAWSDFEGYIATRSELPLASRDRVRLLSEPLVFGPYRTILNRPARVQLPYDSASLASEDQPRAAVYNHVTGAWEPVGMGSAHSDDGARLSFDTMVTGTFAVATFAD